MTAIDKKTLIKANFLLLISAIAFGSSFVATKIALESYSPYVIAFGRLAVGSFALIFFLNLLKKTTVLKKDWKLFFFIGFFEPFLCFILEGNALRFTSASQAGIINAVLPLMVATGAFFFLKERLNFQKLSGLFIAIAGVVWLTLSAQITEHAPDPLLGNLLEILTMLSAAIGIIAVKSLCRRYSWFFITATQILISSVLFIPVVMLHPQTYHIEFAMAPLLAIIYLGLFCNMLAYGFYNYGISKIPASQASVYVNLIPVFAMFFGFLILKEQITIITILASLVVFTGVFISQTEKLPDIPLFYARLQKLRGKVFPVSPR